MGNSPEKGLQEDAFAYYGSSHPTYAQAETSAATRLFQSSIDSTREHPLKRRRLREADAFSDDDSDQESEPSKYDGLGCHEDRENMDPQRATTGTGISKVKIDPICCEQMPPKGVEDSFLDCDTLAGVQDFRIQNRLGSVGKAKRDCWSIHEDVEESRAETDTRSSCDDPTPTKGCSQSTKAECLCTKDECLAALGTDEDVSNESSSSIHEDVEETRAETDTRRSCDGPTPTKGCQNTKVECLRNEGEYPAVLGADEDVVNESSPSIHEDVEESRAETDTRSHCNGPTPTKGYQNTKAERPRTEDAGLADGNVKNESSQMSDTCAQQTLLKRGAMVLLQGLEAQPQMNGLRGLCLGKGKEDRWIIHMDSEEPGSFRNVRSRNLRVIGCVCTIDCEHGKVGDEVCEKSGDDETKQRSMSHNECEENPGESCSATKSLLEDMLSLPQHRLMTRLMAAAPEELITVVSPEASAYILYAKDWRDGSSGA